MNAKHLDSKKSTLKPTPQSTSKPMPNLPTAAKPTEATNLQQFAKPADAKQSNKPTGDLKRIELKINLNRFINKTN